MRAFIIIFLSSIVLGMTAGTIYVWFQPGDFTKHKLVVMTLFSGIIVCQVGKTLLSAIKHK